MANQGQKLKQVKTALNDNRGELQKVLPHHVSIDRFERVTLTAIQQNSDLLSCDQASLFNAVKQCAQDGLIPDGKEAALVKFKNQAAYMPMISGILKKVRQSGEISTITSQVVYEADADRFEYWIDDEGEHLTHRPNILAENPGKPIAVYAMAKTKDGSVYVEVLRKADIDKIQKSSRSQNGGPWKYWWAEMARKSAIRRLAKRLPMSSDLEQVVHRDDQFYDFRAEREVTPSESVPSAESSLEALSDASGSEQVDTDTGEILEGGADGGQAEQSNDDDEGWGDI